MSDTERWSVLSYSTEETIALGEVLGGLLQAGDVVGLLGDLGAGKTHFVRGVGQGMLVDARYPVSSPTFTLINEHPGREMLVHVDLYRLEEIDEMIEVGLFDYLGGRGVCLVEWFDRLRGEEPAERLELTLEVVDDDCRCLHGRAFGERHGDLLHRWRRGWQEAGECESPI
ncbi:MAG: tRNA (adenosine(37)-N6)-threonylcarbamoyltransferase complex ATPase subunit type 1 TsaE [Deltaproteobacteria bacterium]|nr:tRNA (adenosine(37)-N6)-threonylcarbamoyltransferase complex ATPase subunit type 1 TsaE [Deltaproteobacteria bacterium]